MVRPERIELPTSWFVAIEGRNFKSLIFYCFQAFQSKSSPLTWAIKWAIAKGLNLRWINTYSAENVRGASYPDECNGDVSTVTDERQPGIVEAASRARGMQNRAGLESKAKLSRLSAIRATGCGHSRTSHGQGARPKV